MTGWLRSRGGWGVLLCGLVLVVFLIRITGPSDLEGYAQHRNVGYVMDLMWGSGSWLTQHDIQGRILSKPPLHTWTIVPFASMFGVDRLAMSLPSLLAMLALVLLVFEAGRRRFGLLAGGLAGLAMIMAPLVSKHITLVRSDALFTLLITIAALAAWRVWEQRDGSWRGWSLFWLAGALATLTKGPLALVLAAAGLLAVFWERRADPATPRPRGSHVPGLLAFFGITLGWFLAAWLEQGQDLIDKMFLQELVGHATGTARPSSSDPGENLVKPTLYLLARFLPFSLFFFYALWRVFRRPAEDVVERRFERFLTCWVLTGLLIFSLAAHHRPDLLLPLWPACALLAGREMARLAGRMGLQRFSVAAAAVLLLLLGGLFAQYHVTWGGRAENTDVSETIREAAAAFGASGLDAHALEHYGTPVTFQMYLGTVRQWRSPREIEQLLERADGAVLVALGYKSRQDPALEAPGRVVEEVFQWPPGSRDEAVVHIYRVSPVVGTALTAPAE
ncbi:MAG: glycosyltransferase family 39 protein [Pseudazoarcus pumilus]|nr:glycosyltransferase family 39 protein [Pseudazoarcus pumilus]